MSLVCEQLKERLLAGETIDDAESLRHLASCPECVELQENLSKLEHLFTELPEITPDASVLDRITKSLTELDAAPQSRSYPSNAKRNAAIASAVLIASFLISRTGRSAMAAAFIEGSLGAFILLFAVTGMLIVIPAAMFAPTQSTRRRMRGAAIGLATLGLATLTMRTATDSPLSELRGAGVSVEAASSPAPIAVEAKQDRPRSLPEDLKKAPAAARQRALQFDQLNDRDMPAEALPKGVADETVSRMESLDDTLKNAEEPQFQNTPSAPPSLRSGVAAGSFQRQAGIGEKFSRALAGQASASTKTLHEEVSNEVSSVNGAADSLEADKGSGADQDLLFQGDDVIRENYEGVAREHGGNRKSPILFGRNSTGGSKHPDLGAFAEVKAAGKEKAKDVESQDGMPAPAPSVAKLEAEKKFTKNTTDAVSVAKTDAPAPFAGMKRAYSAGEAAVAQQSAQQFKQLQKDTSNRRSDSSAGAGSGSEGAREADSSPAASTMWEEFLKLRSRTQGLTFENPVGYWENTYLPGNPTMRALQLSADRALAQASKPVAELLKSLTDLASKPIQPFDAPFQGALGLVLNADTKSVNGEQRVLLQLGLRGADQLSTARQAIREAVVVDLQRNPSPKEAEKIKALLLAIDKNKDNRDRIAIIFVTPGGVRTIEPKDLRYGTITTTLEDLLASKETGYAQLLSASLSGAIARLATDTSAESAFSAPGVMLITTSALNTDFDTLSAVAYRGSLQGIPTSIFSASDSPDQAQMDTLAIAGRGRAKVLGSVDSAGELIQSELSNVGRVVAQAVRLNIKLQPGVRLVSVVDSKRLNAQSIKEVKEAEKAVDKRLSAALSIPMDRGDDGDGVQIIIPAFYGGDSHVILLDVVVAGPGAVATVSAQFKDLVQLGNKTTRVGLSLENGERQLGRAEYNVLQNYLSLKLTDELKKTAQALRRGNTAEAERILREQLELFQSVRKSAAELQRSSDSRSMIELLTKGLALVESSRQQQIRGLPDVFEYAALKRFNDPVI